MWYSLPLNEQQILHEFNLQSTIELENYPMHLMYGVHPSQDCGTRTFQRCAPYFRYIRYQQFQCMAWMQWTQALCECHNVPRNLHILMIVEYLIILPTKRLSYIISILFFFVIYFHMDHHNNPSTMEIKCGSNSDSNCYQPPPPNKSYVF